MILSCMRYCVVSIRLMDGPCSFSRRSNSVVSSVAPLTTGAASAALVSVAFEASLPFLLAPAAALLLLRLSDLMVGGSWRWSPAQTALQAASSGTQHCASS